MPVFVVVVDRGRDAVAELIARDFGGDNSFALTNDSWLVKYEGTTQSCAEMLHVRGNEANRDNNSGIVFKISNYSGRFNTNVWEWFKLNLESRVDE